MDRLALLLALAGCQPFIAAGVDTYPQVTGAMATMTVAEPRAFSFAVGGGDRDFSVGLGVHVNDLDHAMAASSSLDFQWSVLRWHGASANVHAGPAAIGIADTASGMTGVGYGVRYGAGVALALSIITVFVDWHREAVNFDEGPALGSNTMTGTTLGIALRR